MHCCYPLHKLKCTSFSGLFCAALPPAPQSISSQSLSSTTLRVKWTLLTPVTAEYGTILEYVITCSAQEDLFFETVRRNTSQSTMTGLEPSTTYNCCVSAENIAGNGMAVCGEGTTLNESTSSGISNSRLMAILTPLILFVICIIIGIICIFGCMYYRRNNRYEINTDRVMLISPVHSFSIGVGGIHYLGVSCYTHCALSIPLYYLYVIYRPTTGTTLST